MSWISAGISAVGVVGGAYLSSQGAKSNADAQLEAAHLMAQTARETNDANMMIAAQNMAQSAAMFNAQLQYAQQQRNDERLGGFDEYGNRRYWHPERGWVHELTPTQQRIQDSSERQQILDRTIRDRMQRENDTRQQDLQREDYRDAESQRDAFRHVRQPSEQAITDMLFARGEQARGESRDDALTAMLRTQNRQGNTSNIAGILSEAAGQSGKDAQTAYTDAILRGMEMSKSIPASERSHRANMYSVFRDRATQPIGTTVQPAAATSVGNFPALSNGGANAAFSRGAPQMPYQQPDFSAAGVRMAQGNVDAQRYNSYADLFTNVGAFAQTDEFGDWWRSLGNNSTASSSGGWRSPGNPHDGF